MQEEEFNARYQLDRYQVIRMLKSRENHTVFLAEDKHRKCEVVIRVLQIRGKKEIADFEEKIFAIANLDHQNILPLVDIEKKEIHGVTHFLLVTPYRPEGPLSQWVQERDGKLPLDTVKDFVQQAANALQYIHAENIRHGNVKLSQFFLYPRKGELDKFDLQLSGLGVVTSGVDFSRTSHSATKNVVHMASEHKNGKIEYAADQYALALMAYELITGDSPFEGNLAQLQQAQKDGLLSLSMSKVLQRALVEDTPSEGNSMQLKNQVSQVQKDGFLSPLLSKILRRPVFDNQLEDRYHSVSDFREAFSQAVEQDSDPPEPLLTRLVAGIAFWFLMTLIFSFFIGSVLNATNMIPAFVVKITSSLGSSLTTVLGFVPGIVTGVGAAYFVRTWKNSKTPLIIAALLSVVTVSLLTIGDLRLATFTDPYTHQATEIYSDLLVNNSRHYNWDVGSYTYGTCFFADGAYIVNQLTGNFIQRCNATAHNFNDFVYEIQMKIIRGNCGGIIFRGNLNSRDYYFFEICSNGNYSFKTYLKGNPTPAVSSGEMFPFINRGLGQANTIAVVARANTFSLYANGQVLDAHITDNSYSDGHIAVFSDMGSEAVFNNVKLWTF